MIGSARQTLLALAVLAVAVASHGSQRFELTIDAPPSLEAAAARVRQTDPGPLERALSTAGLPLPPRVHVRLVPEDDPLAGAVPQWIVALASGTSDIAIFPARVSSYPYDSLESVVRHEIVHLALEIQARGRPLPRWFHEGVAVSVEAGWGLASRVRLLVAAADRPVISQVDELFASPSRPDTTTAYLLAAALVDDVRRRHGAEIPGAVAARVAEGLGFERAFLLETGETPDQAAAAAWAAYRGWARWLPIVTSGTAMWGWILLLAFVAFVLQLRRRARRRREWAEEEKWTEPPL